MVNCQYQQKMSEFSQTPTIKILKLQFAVLILKFKQCGFTIQLYIITHFVGFVMSRLNSLLKTSYSTVLPFVLIVLCELSQ